MATVEIRPEDLEVQMMRARPVPAVWHCGPDPELGVKVTHSPTLTTIFVCSERSQLQNKRLALVGLEAMLNDRAPVHDPR